jgi:hypothetical protein
MREADLQDAAPLRQVASHGVFFELVGMEPGEREKFNWKAVVTE